MSKQWCDEDWRESEDERLTFKLRDYGNRLEVGCGLSAIVLNRAQYKSLRAWFASEAAE
jgi:hypothetical protein